jgi:hypothetical protein
VTTQKSRRILKTTQKSRRIFETTQKNVRIFTTDFFFESGNESRVFLGDIPGIGILRTRTHIDIFVDYGLPMDLV